MKLLYRFLCRAAFRFMKATQSSALNAPLSLDVLHRLARRDGFLSPIPVKVRGFFSCSPYFQLASGCRLVSERCAGTSRTSVSSPHPLPTPSPRAMSQPPPRTPPPPLPAPSLRTSAPPSPTSRPYNPPRSYLTPHALSLRTPPRTRTHTYAHSRFHSHRAPTHATPRRKVSPEMRGK